MKITNVQLTPVHTPRWNGEVSEHVIVELESDEGLVGLGEMSDLTDLPMLMPDLRDLERNARKILVGLDPFEITKASFLLSGLFSGRQDPGLYTGAISCGLEVAMYDLAAKSVGLPLCKFLGGPTRDRIKVCYPIFRNYSEQDVRDNLERVQRLRTEGFDVFRLYIGGNPTMDELFLKTLREEVGTAIRMQAFDLSGHLERMDAYNLITRLCEYYVPEYVESVVPPTDLRGMADVRRRLNIPVSEHVGNAATLLAMWEADAIDIVNVQDSALGGLRESIFLFRLAARC